MAELAAQPDRAGMRGAALRRWRGRRSRAALALPVTPLIDVIFLLLLYFMLAGRFQAEEGAIAARVAPAETQTDAFALPEIPAIVHVGRGGPEGGARIHAPEPIDLAGSDVAALAARARELLATGGLAPSQRVIVRASASARWQDAIDVIAALSRVGLSRVVVDTEQAP